MAKLPVTIKFAITAENYAKLHLYNCDGYHNRGTAAVIHVAGPDFRVRLDINWEEAVGVLAKA